MLLLPLCAACRSSSPEPASQRPAAVASPAESLPNDAEPAPIEKKAEAATELGELSEAETQIRRAKASEARVGLAVLSGAVMAIHDPEHICHLWPEGKIGPVPPLDVRCEDGPDRSCVVVDPPDEPSEPWEYSASAWDTPEWRALKYRRFDDHHYRYSVEWRFEGTGEERQCVSTVSAVGDLDGDGVKSEFQIRFPAFSEDAEGKLVFTRITNELE